MALLAAVCVWGNAFAQQVPVAPAVPAPAAPIAAAGASKSTIATITDLAQQLKIEQLRKDLREAKGQQPEAAKPQAAASAAAALQAARKMPTIPSEPPAPTVKAIFGQGGVLTARLADGRDVLVGQRAYGWVVTKISPSLVWFERCPPGGPAKGGRTAAPTRDGCTNLSVGPSPV